MIRVAAHPKQLGQTLCVNAQALCVQLQVYHNCAHTTCARCLGRSTQIAYKVWVQRPKLSARFRSRNPNRLHPVWVDRFTSRKKFGSNNPNFADSLGWTTQTWQTLRDERPKPDREFGSNDPNQADSLDRTTQILQTVLVEWSKPGRQFGSNDPNLANSLGWTTQDLQTVWVERPKLSAIYAWLCVITYSLQKCRQTL
jgi:hypothetical protein